MLHRPHRGRLPHLRRAARPAPGRRRPSGSRSSSTLIDHQQRDRLRLRVQVPGRRPDRARRCSTSTPGPRPIEREVFDMFGIEFDDHPDLTRILMPEDWVGHPLRKDYAVGRIPVQFKAASRTMSTVETGATHASTNATSTTSAVLRLSEAEAAADRRRPEHDDDRVIINMGPPHPSTHGVLRLMLEMDGETVLRSKPVVGYLHTGMEKTGRAADLPPGLHQRHPHGLRRAAVQRAGVLPDHRAAARRRGPAAGHVDPHADVRAQPDVVAPAVHGHQRHGPRRGVDDDLRLARARGSAAASSRRSPACG